MHLGTKRSQEMNKVCPECQCGNLYGRKTEDGFTKKTCYVCGYYWNNSEGYSELDRRLFKKYFPTDSGWKKSPAAGRNSTSPEHWTEPESEGIFVIRRKAPDEPPADSTDRALQELL
jgi:hypothetical protein